MVDIKNITVIEDWIERKDTVQLNAGATYRLMLVDDSSVPLCEAWDSKN